MKVTDLRFYGGARERIARLGLAGLFVELLDLVMSVRISMLEERNANGGAVVRKHIDEGFEARGGWIKQATGGTDWVKEAIYSHEVCVRLGVEVQISARSDLLIRDIVHLRNDLREGGIDVGVIIVPSNSMQLYLPDRTPAVRDAERYIEAEFVEAQQYPLVVIGVEHDAPAQQALAKQKRKR